MFPIMLILNVLEGLISSVPQAVELYQKIVPMLAPADAIPQTDVDAVVALAPEVHAAVDAAHQAIATLVATHAS